MNGSSFHPILMKLLVISLTPYISYTARLQEAREVQFWFTNHEISIGEGKIGKIPKAPLCCEMFAENVWLEPRSLDTDSVDFELVDLQIVLLCVALGALIAPVSFPILIRMNPHVLCQVSILSEASSAILASEGFFPSVSSKMVEEVPGLCEPPVAVIVRANVHSSSPMQSL